MKNYILLIVLIAMTFCTQENSFKRYKTLNNLEVVGSYLVEGDSLTINFIADSSSLDTINKSLFFKMKFFTKNNTNLFSYVELKNGKAIVKVPNDVCYLEGYFYTLEDKCENTFFRRIHYKDGSPIYDSLYHLSGYEEDDVLLKERLNAKKDTFLVIREIIGQAKVDFFNGKISDTTLKVLVNKYLPYVEANHSTENLYSLVALSSLYGADKQYKKSQAIVEYFYEEYTYSSLLTSLKISYLFDTKIDTDYKEDGFLDSLGKKIAIYHPTSHASLSNLQAFQNSKYAKYYKKEDIINNSKYYIENIDSTNNDAIKTIIELSLEKKQLSEARKWIYNYISFQESGGRQHFVATSKEDTESFVTMGNKYSQTEIALQNSYKLLLEVEKNYRTDEQQLFLIDSIYNTHKKQYKTFISFLFQKPPIQKKIKKYNEALNTYEFLYNQTQNNKILDSIKVLFKETQQEKGFEIYAKNLKERVENEDKKPKKLAANFSIKDMSGYEIKLSEWKGRVVVLNFWANYCLPCAKEIPFLNKIWRETQTKDIIFLAVTKDSPLVVQRFAQRQKEMFSFSILPNAKELADVYDVNLVPTTIVINKKGEIVHKESGFSGNIDKLKQVILKELDK